MSKTLIIAEKPSVMTDLARALAKPLGKFDKKGTGRDSYFENDKAVITSAVGHLVELKMPAGPNGKSLPWNFSALPAIPPQFELTPVEKTKARFNQVTRLARRRDVSEIVNACDAGREGELIFRYIIDLGGIDKPVRRLWMQSMTQNSILEAWNQLRSDQEMQPLADAARCRSESDWLVGLNATRALTAFNSRHGGFNLTAAGRVQTPTLAILATRQAEIEAFEPETYFEVHGTFDAGTGDYPGRWIDESWKKDPENPHSKPERLRDRETADAIAARCIGQTGEVTETKKAQTQIAPLLYDLTTLQREAPFSAKATLQIAQALYEKHKVITYPRTDSRYLPEDYTSNVRQTMGEIAASPHPAATHASAVLEGSESGGPRLVKSRRVFDNKKVSDHFAIIPTGRTARLSETEQKVFDLIVRRFIAVFFPPAEFEQTTRLTRFTTSGTTDTFRTDGRVLVKPGWLAVYGRTPGVAAGKDELVPVDPGSSAKALDIEVIEDQTKPPPYYTESTLLSAMEGAGKMIDDEALREAMAERGLGTPATRAATIEGLISQKYIERDKRDLKVTRLGMRLIELVREMGIEGLSSPKLTGDWEYKLRQMEQGRLKRDDFMAEIESYTRDIVRKARDRKETLANRSFPDVTVKHPVHGELVLKQTDATYESAEPQPKFRIKKYIAGRLISESELRELFARGTIGPLTGFKSRFNQPFDAGLTLDEKFKVSFVFDNDDREDPVKLTDEHFVADLSSPEGKALKLYETEKAYHVPAVKTNREPDGIRIGKTILQRELPREQIIKMLSEGKTDVLKGFISNRTKRPFDAALTFDYGQGKIGFEFPPRPAAKKKKKAAAKSKSS